MAFFTRLRSFAGWSKGYHLGQRSNNQLHLQAEELEERQLLSTIDLQFGTLTSPTAPGYTHVSPIAYTPQTGFGWQNASGIAGVFRNTSNPLTWSNQKATDATFIVDLPNGSYNLTVTLGDSTTSAPPASLFAQGNLMYVTSWTRAGHFTSPTFQVTVTGGQLDLRLVSDGASGSRFALDTLQITSVTTTNPPTVSAGANQAANEGQAIQFQGTASGATPLTYRWDFGDGTSASGTLTPTKTYTQNGTYTVTLTVTDALGQSAQAMAQATIADVPPTATLTNGGPVTAGSAATVSFSNVSDPAPADTQDCFHYSYALTAGGLATSYAGATDGVSRAFTFASSGSYTVYGRVFVQDGASSDYTTVVQVNPAAGPATASFVTQDTSSQGHWMAVYGADGYNVIGDRASYPAYAQVSASGASNWTWNSSTTDARALQKPSNPNTGIAATWFANQSFTIDVNLTDGQQHALALYLLDWDSTARSERIDVLDASTGTVLNSQSVAGFHGGEYLVWNVSGHARIQVTNTSGGSPNAVVSGLFFGPPVTNSRSTPVVNAAANLTATQGVSTVFALGSFSDPGPNDGPWTVTVNWGHGTNSRFTVTTPGALSQAHTYATTGNFTAVLAVSNSHNLSASANIAVTVTAMTPPSATLSNGGPANEGSPASVAFSNPTGSPSDVQAGFHYSYALSAGGLATSYATATDGTSRQFTMSESGSCTIYGRIFGQSGLFTDYTTVVQVNDVAPAVTGGSNQSGTPGSATTFALGSFTDPGATDGPWTVTVNWGDGTTSRFTVNSPGALSQSHTYASAGSYSAVVTVSNQDNLTGSASTAIAVSAATPPTATLSNGGPVTEGSAATVTFTNATGSPGDVQAGFHYTYAVSASALATSYATATDGPSGQFTLPESGSYTIYGRIFGQSGLFTDYTTVVQANDVNPAVNAPANLAATQGIATIFGLGSFSDPGASDGPWTVTVNWGDATTTTFTIANPGALSATHTYASIGTFAAVVTVTNQDNLSASGNTAITVSAATAPGDFITTPYDKIPNFGAHPTVVSARSGAWSSPSTWSTGVVPVAGDIVSVQANTTVTYDVVSDAVVNTVAIQNGGHLVFRTDITTRLTVLNLLVMSGGELQIGTQANPVSPNVEAEIKIADVPIDTTADPEQFGHGLIALGTVTMSGATKTSFVQLGAEAHAGATTLTLAQAVTGWQAGDRLALPDSRYVFDPQDPSYTREDETATIQSVSADGTVVTLAAPLAFDHLGARNPDGVLTYLPHVANLSRGVVVHSANPHGTRGYTLFTRQATVDIRYSQFEGLGRSTDDNFDSTTFDANGAVTHVGTNERGRYPVTFDHLTGPAAIPADGYQYTFLGNSVFCPIRPMTFRWGIDINGSDYGLIQDNVLYNWGGASLVTEKGGEVGNVINHNFAFAVEAGTGSRGDDRLNVSDFGFEGSAFWFRGGQNHVTNNVASEVKMYGYVFMATNAGVATRPAYQGADPAAGGSQASSLDVQDTPLLDFTGNLAYGAMTTGLTVWNIGVDGATHALPIGQSVVRNFTVWYQSRYAYYGYPANNFLFYGFTALGDSTQLTNTGTDTTGLWFSDYLTQNMTVTNSNIQGMNLGLQPPVKTGDTFYDGQTVQTFTVENSYLRNYFNVAVSNDWADTGGGVNLTPTRVILNNDVFAQALAQDNSGSTPQANIYMVYRTDQTDENVVQLQQVLVYNYNQVQGDNFQVYYTQQAASFIVPQTGGGLTGSPVAGLTNQQNMDQFQIAIAGAVAPSSATTAARIIGLVTPI
jgi:PKD repeat protein